MSMSRFTLNMPRRSRRRLLDAARALTCLCVAGSGVASSATIELRNGESFEAAVEQLMPGDTLIVHAGTYYDMGRVAITVKGTAALPVLIRAAEGEPRPLIARRPGDPVENTIDIVGATHLTIQGLEITGVPGGDGVNLSGAPSYVTLQDLVVHDVSVGINFRSSMHHITVQRSEIYDTRDSGEGIYVGCHDGSCVVSESLIEGNWIHHTRNSEQGDGIEIKKGSHSNIIRDNVIHDTYYPCLTLYGTNGNPPNIVERNVAWDCDDSAIQIAADAVVRNNIFMPGSGQGISSQSSNGVVPGNLQIVNNTVIGGEPCLRLNEWGGRSGMAFVNNAVYCPSDSFVIGSLSGVTVRGNVFAPAVGGMPSSGYVLGRSLQEDFLDASARSVYPTGTSPLIGTADSGLQPSDDFNGRPRLAPGDAGAYEWNGADNPGWTVVPGLKNLATPGAPLPPQVTLQASPASVAYEGTTTLAWSSANADSCAASGDWAGNKALNGSEATGSLMINRNYTLTCSNSMGQTAAATVTVTVGPPPTPTPAPAPEPPPVSKSGGGGGALDVWSLALIAGGLLAITARRRRHTSCNRAVNRTGG